MIFQRFITLSCLLGALLALPQTASAQSQPQLLENPDFAMDLSGWDNFSGRPAQWTARDATDNPESGSAQVSYIGTSTGAVSLVLTQCLQVAANTEYGYGGTVLVPTGQPADTSAQISIFTFTTPNCTGPAASGDSIAGTSIDAWLPIGRTFITPNAVVSVGFAVGAVKPSGVTTEAQVLFDDLYLRRADDAGLITERLSGSWFNPETPGQGFFLDIAPDINLFFGGWFTWTSTPGEIDWMTVQGTYSGNVATVPISRTTGGAFNDPQAVETTEIGVAEFVFSSCTEGQVTIEFVGTGTTTVIPLQRITPAFPGC